MLIELNAITPQTWLAQTFKDLTGQLGGLGLRQSTTIGDNAKRIEGRAKDDFIAHFESFWFTVKAVSEIIHDLLHAAWRLEALKKVDHESLPSPEVNNDVVAYTAALYEGIYRLIEMVDKLGWMSKNDLKTKFPEVRFVWLLRNNFLVHQKARAPLAFVNAGRATLFPRDERLLPGVVFGPLGFGWTFYYQFHAAKAGIDVEKIDVEQGCKENKKRFVDLEGWDAVTTDEQLLARIKAIGLAPVDQEKLAAELRELFNDVISPALQAMIPDAESRGVFVRSNS